MRNRIIDLLFQVSKYNNFKAYGIDSSKTIDYLLATADVVTVTSLRNHKLEQLGGDRRLGVHG